MTPYYKDEFITLYNGDCRDVLPQLKRESVQCVVTSPPYFGLRDYGTAQWEGGDAECDHIAKHNKHGGQRANRDQTGQIFTYQSTCGLCGATRKDSQIGLEPTPQEFVGELTNVLLMARDAMRKDGTLWLNLGDSYAGSGKGPSGNLKDHGERHLEHINGGATYGLKPKDLIGIPWRVAFALQDAGFWLRQDIIWSKPNPMPESVRDRCTKAHEYIFLLTKAAKYFYDGEAIAEPIAYSSSERLAQNVTAQIGSMRVPGKTNGNMKAVGGDVRNKRSVWNITTKPYSEAHFATFPPELPETCIKAGTKEGDTVLDPFAGAGTTLIVAKNLGRKAVGIELNPDYCEIIVNRIKQRAFHPLFELTQNTTTGG